MKRAHVEDDGSDEDTLDINTGLPRPKKPRIDDAEVIIIREDEVDEDPAAADDPDSTPPPRSWYTQQEQAKRRRPTLDMLAGRFLVDVNAIHTSERDARVVFDDTPDPITGKGKHLTFLDGDMEHPLAGVTSTIDSTSSFFLL